MLKLISDTLLAWDLGNLAVLALPDLTAARHDVAVITKPHNYVQQNVEKQETQPSLTNPCDAFRGQSRSPNTVLFHMLGMVSC